MCGAAPSAQANNKSASSRAIRLPMSTIRSGSGMVLRKSMAASRRLTPRSNPPLNGGSLFPASAESVGFGRVS
jgi:hypothetical protein